MLPTLSDEPPAGEQWIHEIKHDGYRTQLHLDGAESQAFTRNGHDWSAQYRCVLDVAHEVVGLPAIIDGEIAVQDQQGRSDYHALRGCISNSPERLIFYAYDLMWLSGQDIRKSPLLERREQLQELIGANQANCCLQYSDHVLGSGAGLFQMAEQIELEGIVSKKATSRYSSGRSLSWLKTKTYKVSEMVVIGHQRGEGPSIAILAEQGEQGLEVAGGAFITLGRDERERFWREMDRLERDKAPVRIGKSYAKAKWVEPEFKVRVKHLRGEGKLRHASLCGLA
jgi:DNA ligase D-like protein (predicted ligase)